VEHKIIDSSLRSVLSITIPVLLSMMSTYLMLLIDRAMLAVLSRHSSLSHHYEGVHTRSNPLSSPSFRHCDRSEAIHCPAHRIPGLLRRFAPRMYVTFLVIDKILKVNSL
jgi:hypothetical protein